MSESEIQAKVQHDASPFRFKLPPFEDVTPEKALKEYSDIRLKSLNREQNLIKSRFPALNNTRDDSFGSIASHSKEDLNQSMASKIRDSNEKDRSLSLHGGLTLAKSLKRRCINKDANRFRKNSPFIPVNPKEAKISISSTITYPLQNYKESSYIDNSFSQSVVCHDSAFKPISPAFKIYEDNNLPLNKENKFTTFLNHQNQLPRLTVLDNFNEINRLMTKNYLKHRKYDHNNMVLGAQEQQEINLELDCQNKMTKIMKKMCSPKIYETPFKKEGQTSKQKGKSPLSQNLEPIHLSIGAQRKASVGISTVKNIQLPSLNNIKEFDQRKGSLAKNNERVIDLVHVD